MSAPVCPNCNIELIGIAATRREEITKQFVYSEKENKYKLDYIVERDPVYTDYEVYCPECYTDVSDIVNEEYFEDDEECFEDMED